jgi:hypothetical protein
VRDLGGAQRANRRFFEPGIVLCNADHGSSCARPISRGIGVPDFEPSNRRGSSALVRAASAFA